MVLKPLMLAYFRHWRFGDYLYRLIPTQYVCAYVIKLCADSWQSAQMLVYSVTVRIETNAVWKPVKYAGSDCHHRRIGCDGSRFVVLFRAAQSVPRPCRQRRARGGHRSQRRVQSGSHRSRGWFAFTVDLRSKRGRRMLVARSVLRFRRRSCITSFPYNDVDDSS